MVLKKGVFITPFSLLYSKPPASTYFLGKSQYRRRWSVLLLSSGWDQVVPLRSRDRKIQIQKSD